jgi:hypothetical protein
MRALALFVIVLVLSASPGDAQAHRLPPRVVGQVVDEVLRTIIPPDSSLSRVRVRDRGVYFDFARTLASFGYRSDAVAAADLELKSKVRPGTRSLLEGCTQVAPKPCERLGWSAYVWLDFRSMSDNEMVVRLNVSWPERGFLPFQAGAPPSGKAFLEWFSMEVHLTRAADGRWEFRRIGPTRVGD